MNRIGTHRQLRWLMIMRVVTVTTLLVCTYAVELLLRPDRALRPLFFLAGAAYALVLLWAVLDRWLSGRVVFLYLQLLGDAAVVSGFVSVTGALDSPMSFLYLFPILIGSILLYRNGTLVTAGACWSMYATVVLVGPLPWLAGSVVRTPAPTEPFRIGYFLVVHLLAFVAVALLGSYLSERLRITGHQLAERTGAVARLQALNENIIESINSGLITTDSAGCINFMNRGGAEITGFAPGEVLGRTIDEFLQLEPHFLEDTQRTLCAERRLRFERDFRTADGGTIFLGVAASNLYDRSGALLGLIFIFQDLTEIQALEQEVRLGERMASLGEMAAGMAHELRNPLAAISGAVQYLKGGLRPGGETLELMDIILRESQRLEQAIRDFLTFARPGAFEPSRTEMVRLLEDNLKLLVKTPWFGPRHHLATHYESPQIWCDVDADRVKQVCWNLATNALKAMPDGGMLSVSARTVDGGQSIEIGFRDQGRGMSVEEREGYFQPFRGSFREGTGLGAAIVFRLVEEHGGRIHVDSTPDQGTEVRVQLPTMQAGLPEPVEAERALRLAGGTR